MSRIELLQSHPIPYLDCNIIILIKIVHLEVFTEHFTNMLRHTVFTGPHGESEHLQTSRGLFLFGLSQVSGLSYLGLFVRLESKKAANLC